ncbi:MAG: putative zinc-binding protein [Sedimentisphaerales bacterium]
MCAEKSDVHCGGPKLIFPCSGAADVGEISDRAARKLTEDGVGKMFCLAGIGGRIEQIMQKTSSASKILAIDGCGLDCVKNSLEQAGFADFQHLRVDDLGMEKGSSPATEKNINKVAAKGKEMIL